jgi:hypothetical protein
MGKNESRSFKESRYTNILPLTHTSSGRKRPKPAKSGDESESASSRSKKRPKSEHSGVSSKKRQEVDDVVDEDSDASAGTNDTFMNELKAKNDLSFDWGDVNPRKSSSQFETDDDSPAAPTENERQRPKAKPKTQTSRSKPKAPAKATLVKPPSKPPGTPTQTQTPHFPFMVQRSLESIKPAKRKPGNALNGVKSDDKRQKPMTLSHLNNIKKKQAQEPPPDVSAIAVFRPDAVITTAARTMKSGRGYGNAVGDIETAISLSQKGDTFPLPEHKESATSKPPVEKPTLPLRRRSSVLTEALALAAKIRDEATPKPQEKQLSPTLSPLKISTNLFSESTEEAEPSTLADAWPKRAASPPRRASYSSGESSRPYASPLRRRTSSGDSILSPKKPTFDGREPLAIDTLPTLTEDGSRTWTGELLYSDDLASFGTIRLFIPQSSTRIKQLPTFSGSSICLRKVVSVQYLSQKWFPSTAAPSEKPECLVAEFHDRDAQIQLIDALRNTDSAGLVFEETCTLLFFFKRNDRLRPLFNVESSSNPIGVALLEPMKMPNTILEAIKSDEVNNSP